MKKHVLPTFILAFGSIFSTRARRHKFSTIFLTNTHKFYGLTLVDGISAMYGYA